MSSSRKGSDYNIFVRAILRMPRPVRILCLIVAVLAMIILTMNIIQAFTGPGQGTEDPTADPTSTATYTPAATPTATPDPGATGEPTASPDVTPAPTQDATPTPTPDATPTPVPVVYDTYFKLPDFSTRPVAVVVDNRGNAAQYLSGIREAQLVYEMVGEKGSTTLMPIYWNMPDSLSVGNMGGLRHYMLNIAAEHQAVVFGNGASVYAQAEIEQNLFGIKWFDAAHGQSPAFSAAGGKTLLNSLGAKSVMTANNINTALDAPNQVFKYLEGCQTPSSGKQAYEVVLSYDKNCSVSFTWDPDSHMYLRWRNDVPQYDMATGQQLATSNILMLRMESNPVSGDPEGMQEVNMTGNGIGWYITEGMAQQILWTKTSRGSAPEIRTVAGEEIMLNPGQTWISIVPVDSQEIIN